MIYSIEQILKNKELVKRVNKVFHDVYFHSYEEEHPEIYKEEGDRWVEIFKEIKNDLDNIILLDIGTGNGFVISVIKNILNKKDKVIFSDISEKMLGVVGRKFLDDDFSKSFLIADASNINLPDESVNVVTVNSVLHHLPDFENFLREANRVLKKDGFIIIRHEPNILFGKNLILKNLFNFLQKARKNNLYSKGVVGIENFIDKTLVEALSKNGIDFDNLPLKSELQMIVDVQSPTAGGGFEVERGFEPFLIKKNFLVNIKKFQ